MGAIVVRAITLWKHHDVSGCELYSGLTGDRRPTVSLGHHVVFHEVLAAGQHGLGDLVPGRRLGGPLVAEAHVIEHSPAQAHGPQKLREGISSHAKAPIGGTRLDTAAGRAAIANAGSSLADER
jgi:hypothetical protein